MKSETGSKESEIWLLGDSNPKRWQSELDTPLDPKHPARHNIWTPIVEGIQERAYEAISRRMNTKPFYIRNAVQDPSIKPPHNQTEWDSSIVEAIQYVKNVIKTYEPRFLFSFGAFSFEFARRSLDDKPPRRYSYWGARKLGEEFEKRIMEFDVERTNLIPLLHVSIARGKFLLSHEYFCNELGDNYFEYVAETISRLLIKYGDYLGVWI